MSSAAFWSTFRKKKHQILIKPVVFSIMFSCTVLQDERSGPKLPPRQGREVRTSHAGQATIQGGVSRLCAGFRLGSSRLPVDRSNHVSDCISQCPVCLGRWLGEMSNYSGTYSPGAVWPTRPSLACPPNLFLRIPSACRPSGASALDRLELIVDGWLVGWGWGVKPEMWVDVVLEELVGVGDWGFVVVAELKNCWA